MYLLSSNKIKKIIVLILSFLFVLPCLASCEKDNETYILTNESSNSTYENQLDRNGHYFSFNPVYKDNYYDENNKVYNCEVGKKFSINMIIKREKHEFDKVKEEVNLNKYYVFDYPKDDVYFYYTDMSTVRDDWYKFYLFFEFEEVIDLCEISITERATNHKYYCKVHVNEYSTFNEDYLIPSEDEIINSNLYKVLSSFKSPEELKDEKYDARKVYDSREEIDFVPLFVRAGDTNYEVSKDEGNNDIIELSLINQYTNITNPIYLPSMMIAKDKIDNEFDENKIYVFMNLNYSNYDEGDLDHITIVTHDDSIKSNGTLDYIRCSIYKDGVTQNNRRELFAYRYKELLPTKIINDIEFAFFKYNNYDLFSVARNNGFNYVISLSDNSPLNNVNE